jgi:hypothetical protein
LGDIQNQCVAVLLRVAANASRCPPRQGGSDPQNLPEAMTDSAFGYRN